MCFLARTSALNRAIESLDTPVNAAVRSVFDELDITTVQLSPDEQVSLVDVNTPEDLAALRSQQG
jgi:molybdopterin-guanine dinucleotide biosynthesis protein A